MKVPCTQVQIPDIEANKPNEIHPDNIRMEVVGVTVLEPDQSDDLPDCKYPELQVGYNTVVQVSENIKNKILSGCSTR